MSSPGPNQNADRGHGGMQNGTSAAGEITVPAGRPWLLGDLQMVLQHLHEPLLTSVLVIVNDECGERPRRAVLQGVSVFPDSSGNTVVRLYSTLIPADPAPDSVVDSGLQHDEQ